MPVALTAETHTGYAKGKVQYMAPEQALAQPFWAVGAVIYHLVANRRRSRPTISSRS